MKIALQILLLLLFSVSGFSQITQRNLLANRYKIEDVKRELISKKDWKPYPQTSAEWKERVPPQIIAEIIKSGEENLGKEIPAIPATLLLEYVRNGNRSNFQGKSYARRNQLMSLVLAESIENKNRFTDQIANYVWAICEETYWGVPAHLAVQKAGDGLPDVNDPTVELFGAETAATLALTDYFVGEKLDKVSPLLRKRIYTEAYRKIFDPIKQSNRYGWLNPKRQVNNWNPWIISNVMAANLLLENDETKRAENLHQYMKFLDIYLNGLGEDGGVDEGPSYWFAAGASVFDNLEILQSATNNRINIYDESLIRNLASYIYKMHISDNYFVDFADAEPKAVSNGLMLYRFGKDIKDDELVQFGLYFYQRNSRAVGEGFQKPRRLNDLLTIKNLPSGKNNYTPVSEAWFPDIQVLTARTKSGLFLATHGGHNAESHNHNDVGDFIVYHGSDPVIIDTGRGNYTAKTFSSKRYELWFTQSEYHNLPVINGFGQLEGRKYAAQTVKETNNENESSLAMEISQAYPKEAGIDFWNRNVRLNRVNDSVEIADDYSFAQNLKSLQQVFMTICDVDVMEAGKIKLTAPSGKKFVLNYSAEDWTATIEKPSMEGAEYSSFKSKWDGREIKRIVLNGKNLKKKNLLKYTINAQ